MGKLSKALVSFFVLVLSFGLAGCGGDDAFQTPGGDGTGGTGGTGTSGSLSISVSLEDGSGNTVTSISQSNPGVAVVTVTYDGSPLSGVVVSGSTSGGLASFSPATALTGTSVAGVANLDLIAGTTAGAETATLSVTYGSDTATADVSYSVVAGTTTTTVLDMGRGTGASFTANEIEMGSVTTLSAGGSTTVSVNIVDTTSGANTLYTTPANVTFTSSCTASSTATMDSPVTTVNGTASSTYQANGCAGTDTITASATIGGTTYTATGSIDVAAATVGSIKFTSATPELISLKGTGGYGLTETSEVIFTVYDGNGIPLANQVVDFSLSTSLGGITLSQASDTSNASGEVSTIVQAGTVATSVRVNATVTSTSIFTKSDALVISTGLPDENSFSLSVASNNEASFNQNGCTIDVTIYAADHFGNPAPDGTAVAFQAEGGYIESACNTVGGSCSVVWTSDNPRPADGRATILATAIGEESFVDSVPSDGRYDDSETFTDMPEAWRDDNEDGIRDATEEYLDFDSDGNYNAADGFYNGTLCATGATTCSPSGELIHVRSSNVIIMGDENQNLTLYQGGVPTSTVTLPDDGSVITVAVEVQDSRGQRPPGGTVVSAEASGATMLGTTSFTVANSSSAGPYTTYFSLKAGSDPSGLLTITASVPGCGGSGGLDNIAPYSIVVSDVTAPTVASTTPSAGTTGVAVDTTIQVVFDEAVDPSTINNTNITVSGAVSGNLAGTVTYNSSNKTAFFIPDVNMGLNEYYTITVSTGVTDVVGNPLAAAETVIFKTTP